MESRPSNPWEGLPERLPDETPSDGSSYDLYALARNPYVIASTAVVLLVAIFVIYVRSLMPELPEMERGQIREVPLSSIAYTADGQELARYYMENRKWVGLEDMSPHVIGALLATEDQRFYSHSGVDWRRLVTATWKTAGGDRQGGSTLTMQLARNIFPEVGRAITIDRKFREIMAAMHIERHFTKNEVLEAYLNTVPFNHLAFGIEAAAQTYFSMGADELGPAEAAVLVGMLKGPTRYNPVSNPEMSTMRRNVVLGLMADQGNIDHDQLARLREEPIALRFRQMTPAESFAPYFAEYVRLWASEWARENGYDVYRDGLRIYTTLDSELQKTAQESVERQMKGLQAVVDYEWSQRNPSFLGPEPERYIQISQGGGNRPFAHLWNSEPGIVNDHIRRSDRYRARVEAGADGAEVLRVLRQDQAFMDSLRHVVTQLQVGFVAMDPATGHVKAWVGGRDFDMDRYDKVGTARRQPGSTFKPFVYGAAMEAGYSPHYSLLDAPRTFYIAGSDDYWSPRNANHSYTGQYLTMRDGLAHSVNTVTAQLAIQVTPTRVAQFAKNSGINSPLLAVPALALGTSEVTLLEMTAAYTTFAAMGRERAPIIVTRIEDRDGRVLATFEPSEKQAISKHTAYHLVDMLRDAVDRGTGQRMRWHFNVEGDLAGKTGTTQERADGWFVAMHPELVTGSWVGFNDRRIAFRTSWWGQGARTGLYVTGDFFRAAQAAGQLSRDGRFEMPEGMEAPARVYNYRPPSQPSPNGYRVNRHLYEALMRSR
jgi:penicillin-binding protein 1A